MMPQPAAEMVHAYQEMICNSLTRRFGGLSVDAGRLERLVEGFATKKSEEIFAILPSMIDRFINIQRERRLKANFADVAYVFEEVLASGPAETEAFCEVFGKQKDFDYNTSLLGLIDLIDGAADSGKGHLNLPPRLVASSYRFPLINLGTIDENRLDRGRRLVVAKWEDCSDEVKDGWKQLFRIEAENSSFRKWLEDQSYTQGIKETFGRLGLRYEKWDDPSLAFGCSGSRLERIVCSGDRIKAETKNLAKELTRGKYTGYLSADPKEVWNRIKRSYLSLQEETDESEIVRLAGDVLSTLESCIKQGSKSGNQAIAKGSEVGKSFLMIRQMLEQGASDKSDYPLIFTTWKRQPSLDFYEGNDSGICTSFYGNNAEAMINYFVDKSVSLVDVVHKGRRYGQIYLLAAHDHKKTPLLVLDSLEASTDKAINNLADSMYPAVENLVGQIADEVGFSRILVSGNLYWRHSSRFLDYLMHKNDRAHHHTDIDFVGQTVNIIHPRHSDFNEVTLSKIGGMEPIRAAFRDISRKYEHFVGRMHYFDLFSIVGQNDDEDWKSDTDDYTAAGLLLEKGADGGFHGIR